MTILFYKARADRSGVTR